MTSEVSYYQSPSDLGLPILKLFITNPSGECRQTIYLMERKFGWGWNLNNAIKYLWRLGVKTDDIDDDLDKIIKYLRWELKSPIRPLSEDTRNAIETAITMCQELQQTKI